MLPLLVTRVVTSAVVDTERLEQVLAPRDGMVRERAWPDPGPIPPANDGAVTSSFAAIDGPVTGYRRMVTVRSEGDGAFRVEQEVTFSLAVPWFRPLFVPAMKRRLGRLGRAEGQPFWAPPDRLDVEAATALACLAALSIVQGYLGTLLTQTITFAASDFGADKAAQGVTLAAVRIDIFLSIFVVALADRRGRRRVLLASTAAGCLLTSVGALAPSLAALAGTQVLARGFVTAAVLLIGITAAEEMPAGSRAYAISLLAMAAALGAGGAVILLPLADILSWRVLFGVALVGVPMTLRVGRRLPESRRFRAPHVDVAFAGHGRRFWLLAVSGFLLAMFTAPAAQFQNEYLRGERGFTAAGISLFTILTNLPGGLGIVIGGRLADIRGRRIVGAVGIVGGVGATVLMYLSQGWGLWAWSVVGATVGAATVPALGVYGPELFPTSLRGRANGVISAVGRTGSVIGLLSAGFLARSMGSLGPALSVLAIGPAVLAGLVLLAYPETAHRELEDLNPEDRRLA